MMKYRHREFQRLKDALLREPQKQRLKRMEHAEKLLGALKTGEKYRFQELYRRILGEESNSRSKLTVSGEDALHDLRLLVQDVSERTTVSVENLEEPVLSVGDLSETFEISTKTVDRWRQRGLPSRWFLFGNRKQLGFLKSSVQRFVANQGQTLRRAGSLAEEASQSGKTVERVPSVGDEIREAIARDFHKGTSVKQLAKEYRRSQAEIRRALNQVRAQRLWEQPLDYVYNEFFEDPEAEEVIFGPAPEEPNKKPLPKPPAGLPPYLASLYQAPLLSKEQEAYYFRKMNYLKYRAAWLREELDRDDPDSEMLTQIEQWVREATEIKNLLIRRNLRLVVSVAKKYAKSGSNLFEMISDGNVSLMRAIEKFDYSRGFKLSTYATWAIRKNFARSIPAEYKLLERYRTGQEEIFQISQAKRSNQYEQEQTNQRQREALERLMEKLDSREQSIIATRFGLENGTEPQTLEQVGSRLGVTKERIRQLEARALRKLRNLASEQKLDIPGI